MHLMQEENRIVLENPGEARLQTQINPASTILRRAIRKNIVSFPSQIPVFPKQWREGMQWRMVLLFFVRGWSLADVAARYMVPKHRVCQILNFWSSRALAMGYVDVIDSEAFAECCRVDDGLWTDASSENSQWDESDQPLQNFSQQLPATATAVRSMVNSQCGEVPSEGVPGEAPERPAGVVDSLDAAIAQCEGWSGEFWERTAAHLRDLRAVAAAALQRPELAGRTESCIVAFERGKGSLKQELDVRGEELVRHAVA